jgi:hypothetical protein
MTYKKPLSITSPNHAVALAVYFILGLSGLLTALGPDGTGAMARSAGDNISDVWAVTLCMSSWLALGSALAAKRARKPEYNLKMEMWACIGLTVNLLAFIIAVSMRFGFAGITSLTFGAAFALGFGWRVVQIISERNLLKKARANPHESGPVMADPRNEPDPE